MIMVGQATRYMGWIKYTGTIRTAKNMMKNYITLKNAQNRSLGI